ncbi:MAG: bifunctional riboflavin kinase/FAD synthetase [Solirubrobacteraceae bacterium]
MQITPFSAAAARARRVAVGEFDGVHLGHRAVIAGNDTVVTFEPHPLTVVRPLSAPKLLTSFEIKAQLIAQMGVQELVVVRFDDALAHQSPERFIDDVLVRGLCATDISIGENFRFGHLMRGNAALLGADQRFATHVTGIVHRDGEPISSTRIRRLVSEGEVELAAALLGAPFRIRGEVVGGDRRGRELGFPTANLIPDPALVRPANGVYASRVGEQLAAVNVGVRPTFDDGQGVLIEVFLLDFDGDLYGQTLTVEFIARLRSEQRFESLEALRAQIARDVQRTRELLASAAA